MTSGSPRNGNDFFQLSQTVDPMPVNLKSQFEPQSIYGFIEKVYEYGQRVLGIAGVLSRPDQNVYSTIIIRPDFLSSGTVGAEFYRCYLHDENWFSAVLMMQQRCRFFGDFRVSPSELEFFERWADRRSEMLRIFRMPKYEKPNWMKEGF